MGLLGCEANLYFIRVKMFIAADALQQYSPSGLLLLSSGEQPGFHRPLRVDLQPDELSHQCPVSGHSDLACLTLRIEEKLFYFMNES